MFKERGVIYNEISRSERYRCKVAKVLGRYPRATQVGCGLITNGIQAKRTDRSALQGHWVKLARCVLSF